MKYIFLLFTVICLHACTPKGGSGIGTTLPMKSTMVTSLDLGIPNDGRIDAYSSLQEYINDESCSTIRLEKGDYYISKSLIIPSGKIIDGGQANIIYKGKDAAIYIGKGQINWRSSISDLNIFLSNEGAKGIDASWARAFDMRDCVIQLNAANQIGIYLKGISGKSPYQNVFTTSYISGDITKKNQTGIFLDDGNIKSLASGPNRNIFSNFKQIASVTTAVEIKAGDGNIFSELVTENITDNHFKLNDNRPLITANAKSGTLSSAIMSRDVSEFLSGQVKVISGTNKGYTSRVLFVKGSQIAFDRPAERPFDTTSVFELYESKANNNIISNTVTEARGSSCFAKLCLGAANNYFKNNYITSIGNVKFERECEENSNHIGDENYLVFTLSENGNSSSGSITPSGGFIMPYTGYISGVTISGSGVSKTGTSRVVLKRSGLEITELTTALTNSRNISSVSYLKQFDSSRLSFVKAGQRVSIELQTEGRKNQNSEVMVGILLTRI